MSHLYFTGSAGNVTAGKYNDGSVPMRRFWPIAFMTGWSPPIAKLTSTSPAARRGADWVTAPFTFGPRSDLDLDKLKAIVADPKQTLVNRNRDAMACGWLTRLASMRPILLSTLDLAGAATLLHLPAETFVEYQLDAQASIPKTFLATAAYGDGGPWYIPLQRSFGEGGYEPSVALVAENSEPKYRLAIRDLLRLVGKMKS